MSCQTVATNSWNCLHINSPWGSPLSSVASSGGGGGLGSQFRQDKGHEFSIKEINRVRSKSCRDTMPSSKVNSQSQLYSLRKFGSNVQKTVALFAKHFSKPWRVKQPHLLMFSEIIFIAWLFNQVIHRDENVKKVVLESSSQLLRSLFHGEYNCGC